MAATEKEDKEDGDFLPLLIEMGKIDGEWQSEGLVKDDTSTTDPEAPVARECF